MADDFGSLEDDPLFIRLWTIRKAVESGTADPETVERWEELRESVTRIVDSLSETLRAAKPGDRDRAARAWIQAFTDEHWPRTTLH